MNYCQSHLVGRNQFVRSRWLWAYGVVLVISIVDWFVSISTICSEVSFVLLLSIVDNKFCMCCEVTLPVVDLGKMARRQPVTM